MALTDDPSESNDTDGSVATTMSRARLPVTRKSTRAMAGVKHADSELAEKNAKRVVVFQPDTAVQRVR